MVRGLLPGLFTVALSGAALAADTPMQALMKQVDAAANTFWAAGNDPPENETAAAADARWTAASKAADDLQAQAKALLAPDAVRGADWTRYAEAMAAAAAKGAPAIAARDMEAAFAAGGELYESCAGCHKAYAPKRQ